LTPTIWYQPFAAWFWQVFLHSLVMGGVLFFWSRRLRLPSGRTRRVLLGATLALPLFTAAIPGRAGYGFREQLAWFDSTRILKLPLLDGLLVHHLALLAAVIVALVTAWQELMPLLDRPALSSGPPPRPLVRRARSLPGWARCRVGLASTDEVRLATSGFPWSPRLIVSRGALERLSDEELGAVIRHEHAHWTGRRWWAAHLLYAARLLQPFNPVALGCFREYAVELEIDCDEDATRGGGGRSLAGVLLQIYETTNPRDVAARGTLRRRIEALLGDVPRSNDAISCPALVFALSAMMVVLPWLV